MKKHTYSIVLTDTVVQEVDRLAAQKGTNRSTMMNQILADYFSCKTPEKQMASVFSLIEQQMQNVFRVQLQASDAMISLHSALQYKYRPTVRYRVELLRIPTENSIGWLKISCGRKIKLCCTACSSFSASGCTWNCKLTQRIEPFRSCTF